MSALALLGLGPVRIMPAARAGEVAAAFPRSLSLVEAQRWAAEHNFDLLAAQQDVETALGQGRTAAQFPNPNFSFSSSKNKLYQKNSTELGNELYNRSYDSIASISELVETGGKRTRRRQAAAAGLAAGRAKLDDARRQVGLNVTRAYLAALQAEASRRVLEDSAGSLRREANIASTRFAAGDISSSDRDQIDIAAAQLDLNAKTAANTAAAARFALQTLLGVPFPDGDVRLTDDLARLAQLRPDIAGPPPLDDRPDVLAARASFAQATASVNLERANRLPDPTLQVQYEREPPGTLSSLGFAVTVPIPLPGYNEGALRAARAARQQAAVAVDKTRANVSAEVVTARAAFREAAARARRYETQIRPQAVRVRDTVTFAYEKGGASLLALLAAQRAANDVRAATVQAQADRATAAAALSAALNRPFPAAAAPPARTPDRSKP